MPFVSHNSIIAVGDVYFFDGSPVVVVSARGFIADLRRLLLEP